MELVLIISGIAVVSVLGLILVTRSRNQRELEQHVISAEQLESLKAAGQRVLLFDVRQPLDLLAYPELIPGAQRIPPDDVLKTPALLPRNEDIVVYCTCPSDKTSRLVLRRALTLGFSRIKFLRGGLAAWKGKGYPVEPYKESFHLSNSNVTPTPGFSGNK